MSIQQLCIPHGIWITWWEKSILPVRGAVNFLSFLFKFVIHKDIEKIIDLILLYNWFQVISSPALVDIVCDFNRFRSDPEFGLLMNYHQTPSNTFNQWVSAAPPNIPAPTIIVSPDVLGDDEAFLMRQQQQFSLRTWTCCPFFNGIQLKSFSNWSQRRIRGLSWWWVISESFFLYFS